jgi:patatin-related protein
MPPRTASPRSGRRRSPGIVANRSKTIDETVEAGARDEVRHKLERFVRSRWFEPPFGGKRLLNTLLNAFDAMAKGPIYRRLLPPGQPLDLFVTVTDFRGHPEELRLNSPPQGDRDRASPGLRFTDHGDGGARFAHPGRARLRRARDVQLPRRLPAADGREMDEVLEERGDRLARPRRFLEHVLPQQWADNRAEKAVLIDGSVLANAPFRPAIEALRERPARRQVDRRFVFIDPFARHALRFLRHAAGKPGFFQTIIGALSELPREQPIRDNLDAIARRSDRIERMLAIVAEIRAEVETQVEALFGYTLWLDYPTPKRSRPGAAARRSPPRPRRDTATPLMACSRSTARSIASRLLHTIGDRHSPERLREIREAVAHAVQARGATGSARRFRTAPQPADARIPAQPRSRLPHPPAPAARPPPDRDRLAQLACRIAADARGDLRIARRLSRAQALGHLRRSARRRSAT